MFNTSLLLTAIIFSSLWMWYFMYGKKQGKSIPLLSGIILMTYPYFVTDLTYIIIIWFFLMVLPMIIKWDF
jgi:hypothetical protein